VTIGNLLPWLNVFNLLLLPILVYLVKLEHRLTIVEQYERRLALLEARVFERRISATGD
jgi:hypothetical protein